MGESYKGEYSATEWADNFLSSAKNKLPEGADLRQFRGLLDKNNIRENEAQEFLDSYIKGSEFLKEYLQKRAEKQGAPGPEHIVPLPEKQKTEEAEHKIAA
jgi:hypothetical protein